MLLFIASRQHPQTRFLTASSIQPVKPLAETFFRSAIEAGDAVGTHNLLLWKDADIPANGQIYAINRKYYTPVERAAVVAMTSALIQFGTDANKTYKVRKNYPHNLYRRGALELALRLKPCHPAHRPS